MTVTKVKKLALEAIGYSGNLAQLKPATVRLREPPAGFPKAVGLAAL
jgi:hypothetical protein